MKKSELVKILSDIEGDPEVIMSKDSEGNDYSPLADYSYPSKYVAENAWSGIAYHLDEDEANEPNAVDCIVLWPTN